MATTPARLHDKQDAIVRFAYAGLTDTEISQRLEIERETVSRLRRELELPAASRPEPLNLAELLAEHTVELPDGHLLWTGPRSSAGYPIVRHGGRKYTARQAAYIVEHGREPDGYLKAECGHSWCIEPSHNLDTAARQRAREALRAVKGRAERPARCVHGHDQALHGRFHSDALSYCEACKQEQRRGR